MVSIISLVLQEWTREIKRKKEEEWKTIDRRFRKELSGAFEHGRGRSVLFERKVGSEIGRGRGKEEGRKRNNGQS